MADMEICWRLPMSSADRCKPARLRQRPCDLELRCADRSGGVVAPSLANRPWLAWVGLIVRLVLFLLAGALIPDEHLETTQS